MKKGGRIVLVVVLANTLALGMFVKDWAARKNIGEIQRNTYGKGSRTESYQVTMEDQLTKEPFTVEVEEQKYSKAEIQGIFRKVMKELDTLILGENNSLDHIETNLNLVTAIDAYPIQIQWESDHSDVINVSGEIQEAHTKEEGTMVELRGMLTYEDEQALYVTHAVVYPKTKTAKEKLLLKIAEQLEKEEKNTREKAYVKLPESLDGKKVTWSRKSDKSALYVMILGVVAAGCMAALEKQNQVKAEREKREQMLTDYPEIINKFTLLLSTGMTVKSVWEKIVHNYEERKNVMGVRAAYEEMKSTYHEMNGGITEAEAYERFGKRCKSAVYIKFGAMLSQNLRKGTKGMTELLQMESIQAFENRKSRAKRLGEEASTKLLIPMFAMLAVVLVIVVVPAFLSIQL